MKIRQSDDQRKPRIGLDTVMVRLHVRSAPASILAPLIPSFRLTSHGETKTGRGTWTHWTAWSEKYKIRLRAHTLERWPGLDGDDVVSGSVDVTFEVSRIRDILERPDAKAWLNQGICTGDEAGAIVTSVIHDVADALELQAYDVEVLRVDCFCDFTTTNKRAVLDAFSKHQPHVKKGRKQFSTIYQPGAGTVEHPRYKGREGRGRESTKLYSRAEKIKLDCESQGWVMDIPPGCELDQTLRLECSHGKEKKGGCLPIEILPDYSARVLTGRSAHRDDDDDDDELENDDEGPENEQGKGPTARPTLSLEAACNPKTWAALLLSRLKECRLYGEDLEDSIVVTPSRSDLRRVLVSAGVSRGTASQYADIVFEGAEQMKKEGYDVSKISKKVESITGKTFVSLSSGGDEDNDRQPVDPFTPLVRELVSIARASADPHPSTWTRLPIFLPKEHRLTNPHGSVREGDRQGAPLHPAYLDQLLADLALADPTPLDPALPAKQGTGIVRGGGDCSKMEDKLQVRPLSARAETGVVLTGSAKSANNSSLLYGDTTGPPPANNAQVHTAQSTPETHSAMPPADPPPVKKIPRKEAAREAELDRKLERVLEGNLDDDDDDEPPPIVLPPDAGLERLMDRPKSKAKPSKSKPKAKSDPHVAELERELDARLAAICPELLEDTP